MARAVAPSAHGKKLVIIGGPQGRGPARIMDAVTGRTRKILPVADDVVDIIPAELRSDGTSAIVAAYALTGLYVFDLEGNLLKHTPLGAFASTLAVADFDGDGKTDIAVGSQDGKVWILDAEGAIQAMASLPAPVVSLGVLAGQKNSRLVAATSDGTVVAFKTVR